MTAPMTQVSAPAPTAVKSAPAPAAEPSIMNASDLSSSMISATPPVYPVESRRKHEQGTVVLKLLLGIDGRASSVDVTRSSGSARLDQAALAAVRKWRWKPVVRDGEPVLVQGIVTIPFVLRSS
ncbi:energy transducer TonB [Novosphingobium sp. 9]|uniref:energy transducer TonB n=1 Tax=Novosphingobium sp. 9 TaxID=2025349 RepID=UPI0021B4E9B8|nr:energy transducer TonB [Novosphingobium sp. 9]